MSEPLKSPYPYFWVYLQTRRMLFLPDSQRIKNMDFLIGMAIPVDMPDGWTMETLSFGGIRSEERKHMQDCVMFSPACHQADRQAALAL